MADVGEVAAAAEELELLVTRLSRLSPLGRRAHRDRIEALIAVLVEVSARQQGRPLPSPAPEEHALADVVAVIGREVLETLIDRPDAEVLDAVRTAVAALLAATR